MAHLSSLTSMGLENNPTHSELWFRPIGILMLNFGTIELITYQYLDVLEETEEQFLENTKKLLGKRIFRIEELVVQKDVNGKDKIIKCFSAIKELAKWRNRIAHNPILPTWKPGSDSENNPPDLIGIPDMKQITKENKITDSISLEGINRLIDETSKIGNELFSLYEKMKT